jgi:hypothetical protein
MTGLQPFNIRHITNRKQPRHVILLINGLYLLISVILNGKRTPFDGLTPLRGKWDEYFLLRALLNRRETKMSPQTYRWFVCSLCVNWWKCYCDRSRVAHHYHARITTSRPPACLSAYLPTTKSIGAWQWVDLPPRSYRRRSRFTSYLPTTIIILSVWTTLLDS